jgi:hypothetical protein
MGCALSGRDGVCRHYAQVLVPPLRDLEGYIFDQMFNFLW